MARISILSPLLGTEGLSSSILPSPGDLITQEQAMIREGALRAATGYRIAAQGYRSAAENVAYAAAFNSNIDRVNTAERLRATSRSYNRLIGQQIVSAAKSGISVGSKSAMMLQNEALDAKSRELRLIQQDASNKAQAAKFETDIRVGNLTQQAMAAEISASEELARAERRILEGEQADQASSAVRTISLLGRLI